MRGATEDSGVLTFEKHYNINIRGSSISLRKTLITTN